METVDIARSRITTPSTIHSPARFIFQSNGEVEGVAAVWLEQRRPTRSASRVLLATGMFALSDNPRAQHTFTTSEGEVWSIQKLSGGGCGCNKKNSPLAGLTASQLLDPDLSEV